MCFHCPGGLDNAFPCGPPQALDWAADGTHIQCSSAARELLQWDLRTDPSQVGRYLSTVLALSFHGPSTVLALSFHWPFTVLSLCFTVLSLCHCPLTDFRCLSQPTLVQSATALRDQEWATQTIAIGGPFQAIGWKAQPIVADGDDRVSCDVSNSRAIVVSR